MLWIWYFSAVVILRQQCWRGVITWCETKWTTGILSRLTIGDQSFISFIKMEIKKLSIYIRIVDNDTTWFCTIRTSLLNVMFLHIAHWCFDSYELYSSFSMFMQDSTPIRTSQDQSLVSMFVDIKVQSDLLGSQSFRHNFLLDLLVWASSIKQLPDTGPCHVPLVMMNIGRGMMLYRVFQIDETKHDHTKP